MADMAESGSGKRLFVRQSSGLVRDVSVTNALFFNVAAFVGVGLTLYPAFLMLSRLSPRTLLIVSVPSLASLLVLAVQFAHWRWAY